MSAIIRAAAILCLSAGAASADCRTTISADELTSAEAAGLYDCLKDDMLAGYSKGPKHWIPAEHVANYRSWVAASTAPAAPGQHGERFLMTWVNETGADAYMAFAEENVSIPAGTVIAKESFAVTEDGEAVPGPLFFMEKVRPGRSPETDDWFYMMVSANGAPVAVDVATACHACHAGFAARDGVAYPDPEVRATR